MIKALSLLIATTALTATSFAAENISVREHKVSKCKKSSQSRGDYLIKECSAKLSFKNKIVLSGSTFKESKKDRLTRLDLTVLDRRGANYFMINGVRNSTFEPSGKVEVIKTDLTDKAVVYRLDYSAYDSDDSYFRIVTVRLRSNLINPRKTCIVSVSDSKDSKIKLSDSKATETLEKELRDQAKNFVTSDNFANADCVDQAHNH